MSRYEIHEWNETIDSSNTLRPLFTFTPDSDFLKYVQENPGPILLNIHGTNYYDGQKYATCISSANFPTFGPNYFKATTNYVMVVHTDFILFPQEPGYMTINYDVRAPTPPLLGGCNYKTVSLEGFDDDEGMYQMSKLHPSLQEEPPADGRVQSNTYTLILIGVFALLILFVVTAIIYKRYVL